MQNKKNLGHEAVLLSFLHKKTEIIVKMLGDKSFIRGRVKAFDPYTVSILTQEGNIIVVFKHAIECFSSVEASI